MPEQIKITECPRDAMQGLHEYIPAGLKAAYINILLQVGFDTVDFGSFVSAKAIPQMRDTADVLKMLDLSASKSKLLAIIANYRGAEDARQFEEITYLGYPFSISETFQRRNTNSGITGSFDTVKNIKTLCDKSGKQLLVYLSMAFGNPYGDAWNTELVEYWVEQLVKEDIKMIALADTVGMASPAQIREIFPTVCNQFRDTQFGIHLHANPNDWRNKIEAAYESGCRRFDTALKGYGGCPMAKDELTGNIATENLVSYLQSQCEELKLDFEKLQEAMDFSGKVFD